MSPEKLRPFDGVSRSGLKLNINYMKVKSKIGDYSNGNMKIDELMDLVKSTSPRIGALAPLKPVQQSKSFSVQPNTVKNKESKLNLNR